MTTLASPTRLQLWFAPTTDVGTSFLVAEAGLYDCAAAGTDCVLLASDLGVFRASFGEFVGVSFVLDTGVDRYTLASGRVAEVRIAAPDSSNADVFVAYDSVLFPAMFVFG